jgi:dolichol-phosphate mannosyltransferase
MIYFLLPAYNEKDNITELIDSVNLNFSEKNYQIVLVDDGSNDGTAEIIKKLKNTFPITIITHEINMGLGRALWSGFNFLLERIKPEDSILTMDSDNTHPLELAKLMLDKLSKGSDIVIASRFSGGQEVGVKLSRKIYSRMAKLLLKTIFPYKNLNDYTCGYRAFSGSFLKELWSNYRDNVITEKGFTATVEILLKSLKLQPKIAEVPLVLRYDKKKGRSKMKIFRTIIKYFSLILRLKLCSIK